MGGLPERWMNYKPMGKVIPGTRFIAFKVPLREKLCRSLQKDEWFTPRHIIEGKPKISLIVDLTNTTRYYDKNDFKNANVSYVKIFVPGHVVPTKDIISQFFKSVDDFLQEHANDETKLIGVHCTHGVNRTGYFICKYMIDKMGIDPNLAIEDVGRARGYPIERINYLEDLKGATPTVIPSPVKSGHRENWRDSAQRNYSNRKRTFSERERNSYNDRDRSNRRFVDKRRGNNRSNERFNRYGDRPRYGRQNRDFQRPSRGFRGRNSGRPQNWNDRSRSQNDRSRSQNDQGSSRSFSSDRYSQNDRPRKVPRYDDRPNRSPR